MALKKAVLTALTIIIFTNIGFSDTFYVDSMSSDSYDGKSWDSAFKTIGKAVSASRDGDTIIVNEGSYPGGIVFCDDEDLNRAKGNITRTITSKNPNDRDTVAHTIIDGNGVNNVIRLCLAAKINLTGFTIRGGVTGIRSDRGAISTISNCIIEDNKDIGVLIFQSTDVLTNCIVRNNGNAGVIIWSAHGTVKNNLIYDNNEGISTGGNWTTGIIWNNTIVNNRSYGIRRIGDPNTMVSSCIIWNNKNEMENCQAKYSCIKDKKDANGAGDISSDPKFVNAAKKDFHLNANSPCIDAGDPNTLYAGTTDLDNKPRISGMRKVLIGDLLTSFQRPSKV